MTDFAQIAAIRLGYGVAPGQPAPDLAALRDSIRQSAIPGPLSTEMASQAGLSFGEARRQFRERRLDEPAYKQIAAALNDMAMTAFQRRIALAVEARAGLGERLVQFWSDHFSTSSVSAADQVMAAAMVDTAIRPHLTGRFADLLFAAITHPRMLAYLNQARSIGPRSVFARRRADRRLGLNENLAREVLELHTLGVGGPYGQADVTELAELMTGLTFDPRQPRRYRPDQAEPGADLVLGESYGGAGTNGLDEIRRALTALAVHPATARHLARKLAVHFAADDPPEDLVAALTTAWMDSGGDLPTVHDALLNHPALVRTMGQKVRQPLDFLIAALRAIGMTGPAVRALENRIARVRLQEPLAAMQQPFGRARGPDGWPEAAADWITPQGLAARISWAAREPARLVTSLPDPRALIDPLLGDRASAALRRDVPRAETQAEGLALLLASPDFNRR